MGYDVFVSYAQSDKIVADEVCARLEEEDITCWIAPRNILGGMPWGEAIIDAITESRVMILVFSSHSNRSPFVLRELERAVSMRLHIIPLWIENVNPSKGIEFFISATQRVDAYPKPSDDDFEALAEVISGLLATKDERPLKREAKYEKDLWAIEDFLRREQWGLCAKKSIELFEITLKRAMKELLDELEDSAIPDKLADKQKESDRDGANVEHLELEQLIDLFKDPAAFKELQKQKKRSDLRRTKNIDWDKILVRRDTLKSQSDIDKEDTMELATWIKLLLYELEFVGAHISVSQPRPLSPSKKCFQCEKTIKKIWKYCACCGIPLHLECEACGNKLEPGFKICPFCETRVSLVLTGQKGKMFKVHNEYATLCKGVYLDEIVTLRERELLIEKRLALGLTVDEAQNIERQCAPENSLEYARIVQGVLVDGVINQNEREFLDDKIEELRVPKWIADNIEAVELEIRRREMGRRRKIEE